MYRTPLRGHDLSVSQELDLGQSRVCVLQTPFPNCLIRIDDHSDVNHHHSLASCYVLVPGVDYCLNLVKYVIFIPDDIHLLVPMTIPSAPTRDPFLILWHLPSCMGTHFIL